jgi:hypothetical protein
VPGLIGWQAGEPFVHEFVAERSRLVQHGSDRLGGVEGEQVGWVAALRERGVSGVEMVGGEYPEVAFGGDPEQPKDFTKRLA